MLAFGRPSSSTVAARKWARWTKWSAVLSSSFCYLIFVRCEPVATYSFLIPLQGKLQIDIILTVRAWITSDWAIGAYVIYITIPLPSTNFLCFMLRNPFAVHCLRRKIKWPSIVAIIWTRRCAATTPAWKSIAAMVVTNYTLDPVELEEWKMGEMKSDNERIMLQIKQVKL